MWLTLSNSALIPVNKTDLGIFNEATILLEIFPRHKALQETISLYATKNAFLPLWCDIHHKTWKYSIIEHFKCIFPSLE